MMTSNLKQRLDFLVSTGAVPKRQQVKHDISEQIHAETYHCGRGSFLLKKVVYPYGVVYGNYRIAKQENYRDAVFIDTETTGLGAASYPFLVGVGYYTDSGFAVQQLFMRDLDDEPAVMEYLLELCENRVVISYNGKCFDIPLIHSRLALNDMKSKTFAAEQVDLLHRCRRIWRKRLESCSLSSIESNILGFHREGDIPGSIIPEMYKAYLNTGSSQEIVKIIQHNEWDIVSMAVLIDRLSAIEQVPEKELENPYDLLHYGEWCYYKKDYSTAKQCFFALCHQKTNPYTLYKAMKYLSLLHKMDGEWEQAVRIWSKMEKFNMGLIFPYIEKAKYYEHITKEIDLAYLCALKAKECVIKNRQRQYDAEVQHRIQRLKKKLSNKTREEGRLI